jgi:hypothetical protein
MSITVQRFILHVDVPRDLIDRVVSNVHRMRQGGKREKVSVAEYRKLAGELLDEAIRKYADAEVKGTYAINPETGKAGYEDDIPAVVTVN